MKHILIIGDSHPEGFKSIADTDLNYDIDTGSTEFILKNKYSIFWKHGKTAWGCSYNPFPIPDNFDIVIVWFGDVDIRAHLIEKQNCKELVERYVTYAKNFFGGKPVYFLEPIPQVRDCRFPTLQPLEERIKQRNLFNSYLREFGANVISYKDILPNDILEEEDTHDTLHLKKKYIVQIMDKIDTMFTNEVLYCKDLLRSLSQEDLQNPAVLEKVIPLCGLNNEMLNEQPVELSDHYGKGLKVWQYPNQFSKYLAYLYQHKNQISSYLEIGPRWGGTLILTIEYLLAAGAIITKIVACDQIPESELLIKFKELHPEIEFIYMQNSSRSEEFKNFCLEFNPDLVLIDGDHSYDGVRNDFNLVKNSKLVVQHDIVNQVCPGTVAFWNESKEYAGYEYTEFTDQYDSVSGTYLGIGILKLVD